MMAGTNSTHDGYASEQLVGRVLSVNERGVRLEWRDGWLNYSKWAGEIAEPRRGQLVALTLDGSGFVRAVGPAEGAPQAHQSSVAGRETAIIRQACLKASVAFCAARPELMTADLFALAERMEAWVNRGSEA